VVEDLHLVERARFAGALHLPGGLAKGGLQHIGGGPGDPIGARGEQRLLGVEPFGLAELAGEAGVLGDGLVLGLAPGLGLGLLLCLGGLCHRGSSG